MTMMVSSSLAQIPNPKHTTGTTVAGPHVVSIKQVTVSGGDVNATYISNLTISANCTVTFWSSADEQFRAVTDGSVINGADDGVEVAIPLVAGETYNFFINASQMTFTSAGGITYNAVIQYW